MLIVVNGNYKTGSTWIYTMLRRAISQPQIPEAWQDKNFPENIDVLASPEQILNFSKTVNIVTKIHTYDQNYLDFLRKNNAIIIATKRQASEIMLSHHHHFSHTYCRMPFFLYALTLGALKAIETYIYQYISNKEQNNNIVIDYEHLKNDPKSTLKSIYNIIGIIVDDNEMDMIIEESNLRSNSLGKVFPSQLQKTWFLNRVDQKSQYNLKLAIAITNIVSLLMNISIFRYLSLALLKRLPNRTTYKYP